MSIESSKKKAIQEFEDLHGQLEKQLEEAKEEREREKRQKTKWEKKLKNYTKDPMVNTKSRNIEKQDHLTTNSQNDRESRIGSNQEKKNRTCN